MYEKKNTVSSRSAYPGPGWFSRARTCASLKWELQLPVSLQRGARTPEPCASIRDPGEKCGLADRLRRAVQQWEKGKQQ